MSILRGAMIALVCAAPVLAQQPSGARAVSIQGKAELRPAGGQQWRPLTVGALARGDRVRVPKDGAGSATLAVEGQLIVLGPGDAHTVGQDVPRTSGTVAWVREKMRSLETNEELVSRPGAATFRSLKLGNGIELTDPLNTLVESARPRFRWKDASGHARSYHLQVMKNRRTIWELPTRACEADYPADAPALVPGETYFWTVGVRGASEADLPRSLIKVATASDRARLKAALARAAGQPGGSDAGWRDFVKGSAAESLGFLDVARTHYDAARRAAPGTALYRRALSDLELHAGRPAR